MNSKTKDFSSCMKETNVANPQFWQHKGLAACYYPLSNFRNYKSKQDFYIEPVPSNTWIPRYLHIIKESSDKSQRDSLFWLTYLTLFNNKKTCEWDYWGELMKNNLLHVYKLFSTYFHRLSKITLENNLYHIWKQFHLILSLVI